MNGITGSWHIITRIRIGREFSAAAGAFLEDACGAPEMELAL
ncbi:hypothetical protein [Neorhizobium petrolearium]